LSSFIKSYLDTENIQESISFANKLASLSVSKFGTYVLKPEDLKA
jgi:bifunctional ADP-heptose synthase (sugar kinase/adenylyltransferase)